MGLVRRIDAIPRGPNQPIKPTVGLSIFVPKRQTATGNIGINLAAGTNNLQNNTLAISSVTP